ncbi:MAG: Fic family protein [Clostridia bacterium]
MQEEPLISVDADIFNLSNESDAIEGFEFNEDTVTIINSGEMIDKIDNNSVLEFLNCPTTKVFIKKDESGHLMTKMIAHNFIAHETIEITNLGDHIIAMNEMLLTATKKRKELKSNPNAEIISDDMIKNLNELLLSRRMGEVGIGEYRNIDYFGNPVHVMIGITDNKGDVTPLEAWQPEKGGGKNIERQMGKLINWANSDEFRDMDPYLRAAMFHAKFIKIHPFREGNGRTGRMILNYMLLISNLPLTNIRDTDSELYYSGVTEAIVNKNYQPLIDVVKKNKIKYSRELYSALMKYNQQRKRTMEMRMNSKQVEQFNK